MNGEPTITCGQCRKTSSLAAWKGPTGAEHQANRFQCPSCHAAWERRMETDRWGRSAMQWVPVDAELPLGLRGEA